MPQSILSTKLYISPPRSKVVARSCLIERLNEVFHRKLALISAPAGFGKTTLVSEWAGGCGRPAAWLSLDEGDNDPARFLTYLIAALQTIAANIGDGMLAALQTPQPPQIDLILTALLNEITALPDHFVLVLDDYHVIDSKPVDHILTFFLEHLPPLMHLVISTREDPDLPLARLRARNQMVELRAADLRFTPSETDGFLNQVMGLDLSAEDIVALEVRTEGWIAGLQLAAISMRGLKDTAGFIKSFSGGHHFVLDYLVEEVLHQQSESIQEFLLRTSILDRMCGPLCDAVLLTPSSAGQETLEYLEHANLFIVPLDNERNWYRYHHLFADLLRQRLSSTAGDEGRTAAELHVRASLWHEDNGLELEAFHHAAAANDIERAERLIDSAGMPMHFQGAVAAILNWLSSLPATVLDARPSLRVKQATLSLVGGQTAGVEEKLQSAERALQRAEPDEKYRDIVGIIAAARATLALTQYHVETMITQSRRAMEYLHPDNLPFRFTAIWTQAVAFHLLGDRAASGRAYNEALSISRMSGDIFSTILATSGLGQVQELENQIYQAAETYRHVLQLVGDHPQPNAAEVHLGLARILYEWNDLDAALEHGQQSLQLSRQFDKVIDRFIISDVFLARLKLARGDASGAAAILAQADQSARQNNFVLRMPEIASVQVLTLLQQGDIEAAAHLAEKFDLPISRARVHLAQKAPSAALAILEPLRLQMEDKDWKDERLKVMVLQAAALHEYGEKDKAVQVLSGALALGEPGGFIRTFIDEGPAMAGLLSGAAAQGIMPDYTGKLLAAFKAPEQNSEDKSYPLSSRNLIEPLSLRELEILRLISQGLSNHEICRRLFLALSTVKGHNNNIFTKLQVRSRTEAAVRARELGLLSD